MLDTKLKTIGHLWQDCNKHGQSGWNTCAAPAHEVALTRGLKRGGGICWVGHFQNLFC